MAVVLHYSVVYIFWGFFVIIVHTLVFENKIYEGFWWRLIGRKQLVWPRKLDVSDVFSFVNVLIGLNGIPLKSIHLHYSRH